MLVRMGNSAVMGFEIEGVMSAGQLDRTSAIPQSSHVNGHGCRTTERRKGLFMSNMLGPAVYICVRKMLGATVLTSAKLWERVRDVRKEVMKASLLPRSSN